MNYSETMVDHTTEHFPLHHDVKTLLTWHAPGRPFRNHSKEYYVNGILIACAVEILVFLVMKDLFLMAAICAFVFLWVALSIVPPRPFYYKISTEGIQVEDHFFIWEELYDFYFMKEHGQDVLHIGTRSFFPGELLITLGDISPKHIKTVLLPYLPYREYVKPTFIQQAGDWLEKNFPLEKS